MPVFVDSARSASVGLRLVRQWFWSYRHSKISQALSHPLRRWYTHWYFLSGSIYWHCFDAFSTYGDNPRHRATLHSHRHWVSTRFICSPDVWTHDRASHPLWDIVICHQRCNRHSLKEIIGEVWAWAFSYWRYWSWYWCLTLYFGACYFGVKAKGTDENRYHDHIQFRGKASTWDNSLRVIWSLKNSLAN